MVTKILLLFMLSLTVLAVNALPAVAQSRDDQRWIDQLKKTPVGQIEEGLSQASFADWFADVVKPWPTEYEVKECEDSGDPAAKNQERLLCVFAYTKPAPLRAIQLDFVVAVVTRSKEGTKRTTHIKAVSCRFLGGYEGPSDPRMKRMTRKISKLSELESVLHGSATPPNSL